jgi:putative ABC transport system permease protein
LDKVLTYNLQLAWRSLFQRRTLTILMIAAIGIGLGILMTVRTMAYQARQLPAGEKSYSLHFVQMDGRDVEGDALEQWFEGDAITYRDARILMNADTAARQQTFLWKTAVIVSSEDKGILPRRSGGLVGLSNFFDMFDAPFLYGSAWSEEANFNAEPVVVISKDYNDYFFGGENSVGRRLNLGTSTVTVIGVLDDWIINRRYYDMTFDPARRDDIYMSDSLAQELNLTRAVRLGCHGSDADLAGDYATSDIQGLVNSECAWILFWAELNSAEAIQEYKLGIEQHMSVQQQLGRFPREEQTYFLTTVAEHIELVGQFRGRQAFLQIMSNLFFAVCLINAIGILLAKFLSKGKEISLRRALGARKTTIMWQHLLEVSIIGILGGIVGLALSYFGLIGMRNIVVYSSDYSFAAEEIAHAFRLDWVMIGNAFLIAIGSTILVGLYPIWRVCNGKPAQQLKAQ